MGQFTCYYCNRVCAFKANLKKHIECMHLRSRPAIAVKNKFRCPQCRAQLQRSDMICHYVDAHDLLIRAEERRFANYDDFMVWKCEVERSDGSQYVKQRGSRKRKSGFSSIFYCNRDGFFNSKGKNRRMLKSQGSNKMNSCCPSQMKVKVNVSGDVVVDFTTTHFGHENEIGRQRLTKDEKDFLAHKISQNIPYTVILDEVREDLIGDNFYRFHLLTRKDLANIAREYNLSPVHKSVRGAPVYEASRSFLSLTKQCRRMEN